MSVPREDSDGAVPRAAATEPPSGASPEEMEVREGITIEAKEVREAIRFGHADAKERFREFDERCETAGWGRPIADRLFRALHRGNLPQGPSNLLMSLTATVRAFREPTNWRGPARRALERLGSLPESVGILPILEAERDARVRSEEAEQARRDACGKLEEAVAATRDMRARVASIRETWNTRPLSLGEALDASAIPGEAKLSVLDAWRSWDNARSVESDGNAALDKMDRELAALPDSPERTAFDEAGIELHPVDGVPGIFDVAAALKERVETMQKCSDWENAEPKLEDVPIPDAARPSIPEDPDLKRHTTENVLSAASPPVAFLFRNAKYWAISGGVLFLASVCIPPLGRWVYGEPESSWRGEFGLFLTVFGPVLAFEWRRHREEIERMRLYSERADKTIGDRLSELERTHSTSGGLAELLVELAKKRSRAKAVSEDSIRIVKETQGFRTTLPDGLSADERCKNAKSLFFKTWEDVLDAVAAAAAREDRKSELARRTAVWRERGETLAARRRETFELLQSAVESTRRQIAAKRETLETATKSAAATVDAALSEILSRAEIPAPSTEAAARQADAARRAWEAAKAATDAAVANEEEEEKRRAEARIEFARLKDCTIEAIRAKVNAVREVAIAWQDLRERFDALEADLASWEKSPVPSEDGFAAEKSTADSLLERAASLEDDGQKAAKLASIVEKANDLAKTAYTDCDAPDFAKEEMETIRRVLETVARQNDWTKTQKAARILEKVEERKKSLERHVQDYAKQLKVIGRLEQRAERAMGSLLWRDPLRCPASEPAAPIRSFKDGINALRFRKECFESVLQNCDSVREWQFAKFTEMATEALCNGRAKKQHLATMLGLDEYDNYEVRLNRQSTLWEIRGWDFSDEIRRLKLDPQPSILFGQTQEGTFEERCRFVLDWYKQLLYT